MTSLATDTYTYTSLQHANLDHANYVVVNWCLGNTCNFSCSYCPHDLHSGSVKWPSLEEMMAACQRIITHYNGKKIYFEFTGGEVTLWKDLLPLCEYLKGFDCRVGIISNASRSLDYWMKVRGKIDHICCSFHSEKGNPEHFLGVVRFLSQDIRVHVNIMMLPEKFDLLVDLANKVVEIPNISIAIQPLIKDFGTEVFPYSPEQQEIIDKQSDFFVKKIKYTKTFEYYRGAMARISSDGSRSVMAPQRFISSGTNSWKGWTCHAGLEQIVINMDGDVFRGWCNVGGKLGSAFNKKIDFPITPVQCTKSFCHCNLDIMTTKEKASRG